MAQTIDIATCLETGRSLFMGYEFIVSRGVLVPRPVTEVLVRAAAAIFSSRGPDRIVDLGCGSGAIGIVLAHRFPNAQVVCLDISDAAVELSRANIVHHGLSGRVEARVSDCYAALEDARGRVDLAVSSPPFISSEKLSKESAHLLEHEPRAAFDAGPYGIALHQRLIREGVDALRAGSGWLIVEFGQGQDRQVEKLFQRSRRYRDLRPFRDSSDAFVASIAGQLIPSDVP